MEIFHLVLRLFDAYKPAFEGDAGAFELELYFKNKPTYAEVKEVILSESLFNDEDYLDDWEFNDNVALCLRIIDNMSIPDDAVGILTSGIVWDNGGGYTSLRRISVH